MAREGYVARNNAVYKVNQRTGEVTYEGQYGGRGSESIRNSIRTVGARQAARTANAYRTRSTQSEQRAIRNSIRTVGARRAARTANAYRTSSTQSEQRAGAYLGTMPRGRNYERNMRDAYNRMRATTNLRQTRSGRIVASNTSSRRRG